MSDWSVKVSSGSDGPTTMAWVVDGKEYPYNITAHTWDCTEAHTDVPVGLGCSTCRYFLLIQHPRTRKSRSYRTRTAAPRLIEVYFCGEEATGEEVLPTDPARDRVWQKLLQAALVNLYETEEEDAGFVVGRA